jgi:hypothetical protein
MGVKLNRRYVKKVERAILFSALFSVPRWTLTHPGPKMSGMAKATFEQVFAAGNWQPIRNCPGRYALRGGDRRLPLTTITGRDIHVSEHRCEAARDTVLVARLAGGGLISYQHSDGSFVHTLNTQEGFARKLKQLGIEVEEPNADE